MMNPVLRERTFLGGQAVSMLGDGLAILAIPLLIMQLTRSPWLPCSRPCPAASATLPQACLPGCWPTGPIPGSC